MDVAPSKWLISRTEFTGPCRGSTLFICAERGDFSYSDRDRTDVRRSIAKVREGGPKRG